MQEEPVKRPEVGSRPRPRVFRLFSHVFWPPLCRMERRFSEAMFVKAFERGKNCFIFRFGTVVCWDFNADERQVREGGREGDRV